MGHRLAYVHAHYVAAVVGVNFIEPSVHFFLSIKRLDDAQTAKSLLHLAHRVAPERLCLDGLLLKFPAYKAHEPPKDRYENDSKKRQLPRCENECYEVGEDKNGVLEEHVKTCHDGVLYLLNVSAHSCNDVSLAFLAEESERQRCDFLVQLVANVAHHSRSYGHYCC